MGRKVVILRFILGMLWWYFWSKNFKVQLSISKSSSLLNFLLGLLSKTIDSVASVASSVAVFALRTNINFKVILSSNSLFHRQRHGWLRIIGCGSDVVVDKIVIKFPVHWDNQCIHREDDMGNDMYL